MKFNNCAGDDDNRPVPLMAFDCRGLDVIKWHPEASPCCSDAWLQVIVIKTQ